jgi:DNA mismatch repair protein MutH
VDPLLSRALSLSGLTLPELARLGGVPMPPSLARSKGFIGQAVERALGLKPGTGPGPDLPDLEIKTLPVERRPDGLKTAESTFVCTVQRDRLHLDWARSGPRLKLARVLFVPIEARGEPETRRVGSAFLWSPSDEDDARLRADWEVLAGELSLHGHERITGKLGAVLQIRPKAENARALTLGRDETGALSRALPRAFYLRRSFTTEILRRTGLG